MFTLSLMLQFSSFIFVLVYLSMFLLHFHKVFHLPVFCMKKPCVCIVVENQTGNYNSISDFHSEAREVHFHSFIDNLFCSGGYNNATCFSACTNSRHIFFTYILLPFHLPSSSLLLMLSYRIVVMVGNIQQLRYLFSCDIFSNRASIGMSVEPLHLCRARVLLHGNVQYTLQNACKGVVREAIADKTQDNCVVHASPRTAW